MTLVLDDDRHRTRVRNAAIVPVRDARQRPGQPERASHEDRERQVQRGSHEDPLLQGRMRHMSR